MASPPAGAAPSEADARDPHLRLPRALRVARAAEAAFVVVTAYVALSLPLGNVPGGHMVRARLVFEALLALVVLVAMARRPVGGRIAAIVFAAFVLVGCLPYLVRVAAALADFRGAFAALHILITTVACACQLVVLVSCLAVRRGDMPAG